jgi:uncharacterized protein (DUF1499 family)
MKLRPAGSRSRRVIRMSLFATLAAFVGCHPGPGAVTRPGEPLRPCPDTPNCVSTEAPATDATHAMPAIPFHGTAEEAQRIARRALLDEPRTTITLEAPGYLRAEARSRLIRFVDDVEVVVDADARVLRFRSASRVGRGDMGVNRKRMQRFTDRFHAADAGSAE